MTSVYRYGLIFIILASITSCVSPPITANVTASVTDNPTQCTIGDWLSIYFTNPDLLSVDGYHHGLDDVLVNAINKASLTIDLAIYNLNLWSVRDALISAWSRGVNVRIVAESDNLDNEEFQDLIDAGIPVHSDQHEGLMHHKFMIVDRGDVWTGSLNYTLNSVYQDNNNLVHIRSELVAMNYLTEFNEMFEDNIYSTDTSAASQSSEVSISGTILEIYFSPDDNVLERILSLIAQSTKSIEFLAYLFTSDPLSAAIRNRFEQGLTVHGVMERNIISSNSGTEYEILVQADVDVVLDGNQDGLMHHKVLILDNEIVITGSYNFTASAEERNDENVLIIHNKDAASCYMGEFTRLYDQATRP